MGLKFIGGLAIQVIQAVPKRLRLQKYGLRFADHARQIRGAPIFGRSAPETSLDSSGIALPPAAAASLGSVPALYKGRASPLRFPRCPECGGKGLKRRFLCSSPSILRELRGGIAYLPEPRSEHSAARPYRVLDPDIIGRCSREALPLGAVKQKLLSVRSSPHGKNGKPEWFCRRSRPPESFLQASGVRPFGIRASRSSCSQVFVSRAPEDPDQPAACGGARVFAGGQVPVAGPPIAGVASVS
jgi:hypothetical protein